MKDKTAPAFPFSYEDVNKNELHVITGMSIRQYAAIKLRVPNSGTDWLDDMIRKSQRNELAARAMQGVISGCSARGEVFLYGDVAALSIGVADAMIAAQEKQS